MLGAAVRLAEGGAVARHGVPKPQGGEGRHAGLDALIQRDEAALDPELPQPGKVR
jgi:hypothetical protein